MLSTLFPLLKCSKISFPSWNKKAILPPSGRGIWVQLGELLSSWQGSVPAAPHSRGQWEVATWDSKPNLAWAQTANLGYPALPPENNKLSAMLLHKLVHIFGVKSVSWNLHELLPVKPISFCKTSKYHKHTITKWSVGFGRQSNEKKKRKQEENFKKGTRTPHPKKKKRLTGGHWISQARWGELNWGWRMTDSQVQDRWTLTEAADRG